jgi:hypothetical protein
VVCILNKRTAIFFYDSVSTRRKFAAKEDDEERPAESSKMDLDTIRSHIGPKQVLSTGRNPWWPINPKTWAASSIRGGSVIRNPFSTLSCSPSAHVLPSFSVFLLCFFSRRLRGAQLVRHSTEIPPTRVYIRHPAPRIRCLQFPLLRQLDSEKLRRGRFVASPRFPCFSFCENFGSLRPRPTNSGLVSWNLF